MRTVFESICRKKGRRNSSFAMALGLILWLGSSGCAHHAETIISIDKLGCASCLDPVTEKLEKNEGIRNVHFDRKTVEILISYDAQKTSPDKIFALAEKSSNLRLIKGAGKGSYPDGLTYAAEADVQTIVKAGEAVDIEEHLADGKITIVDFSAIWCGPCRALGEHVYDLLVANPGLALRKVEIVDWDSPISKKYLATADELPYVRVYDSTKKLVGDLSGFKPEALERLIEQAAK